MSANILITLQLAYARALIRCGELFVDALADDYQGHAGLVHHIADKEAEHCYEVLAGYTHGNMDKWTLNQATLFILEWERKLTDGD